MAFAYRPDKGGGWICGNATFEAQLSQRSYRVLAVRTHACMGVQAERMVRRAGSTQALLWGFSLVPSMAIRRLARRIVQLLQEAEAPVCTEKRVGTYARGVTAAGSMNELWEGKPFHLRLSCRVWKYSPLWGTHTKEMGRRLEPAKENTDSQKATRRDNKTSARFRSEHRRKVGRSRVHFYASRAAKK